LSARGFVRDSLGLALSQYLSRALLLARGVASAAALGPTGFGGWNALNLILDYGAYASLGAIQGLDLRLPAAASRGDVQRARRVQQGAWLATLIGGALFAVAVSLQLASGTWLESSGWGWGAPLLMLAATFLQLGILYHAASLRAFGDFGAVSSGLALQALVGGGIGIATVWTAGVWGLLWGWLAGGLLAIVWMRRSPQRPPLAPRGAGEGVSLAVAGLPMFAFFALTMVLRSLDRIALVRFGGNDSLGLYSLGLIASGLVLYLPEAAAAVLFPRVAAAVGGARDPEETRRQVLRAQRSMSVLLPLVVGPGVLWAPVIVTRLLPSFTDGLASLRVLSVAALVMSMATLPSYYLLALGRGRSLVVAALGAVVVAAVAIFVVTASDPRPVVVAWAATAGYAAFSIVMLAMAWRRLASPGRERAGLVAGTLLPTLGAALLLLFLSRIPDPTVIGAAWRSVAFLGAYAPVAVAFGRRLGIGGALKEWLRSG
jgi:O-antigen/teichoic acid export membrane protein